MARITTRDCECVVPNRYELVLLAAELARELPREYPPQPDREREAVTVTALRSIAEGRADPEALRKNLWRRWNNLPLHGDEERDERVPRLGEEPGAAQAA